MTTKEWAEKEIEIACKKENPNWDGKSFDYGCACYQSALKAYKSLCEDDHSGFSFNLTKNILIRLMNDLPLKPITDEDFTSVEPEIKESPKYLKEHGLKSSLQCPRMSGLFREETLDGKITYSNVDRVIMHDANGDEWCHSGIATRLVDEMFPITMPYYPKVDKFKVYGETFYMDDGVDKSAENVGTYNLIKIYYIITPDGERIEINKEFE